MSHQNYELVHMCGIPCYSLKDSFTYQHAGGAALRPTAKQTLVGSRIDARVSTISGSIYPTSEADHDRLRVALRTPGIKNFTDHDGVNWPCRAEQPQAIAGFAGNFTRGYTVQLDIPANCDHADQPAYSMSQPGAFAAHIAETNTPYVYAGTVTLATGPYQLTGNAANYQGAYLSEQEQFGNILYLPRPQPILEADFTIGSSATGALGFRYQWWLSSIQGSRPFLANGLGLTWSPTSFAFVGYGDVQHSVRLQNTAGRFTLRLVARLAGARMELWQQKTRLMFATNVKWTPPVSNYPPLAVLTCKSGLVQLHRWSVMRI